MIGLITDIETTGYKKITNGRLDDGSEILEVGFIRVDMDTAEIINSGTLYFYKDYFRVESEAQKVHGLKRSFLEQYADKFDNNLIILNSLIQQTCIIGKNSDGFDIPFIKEFILKHADDALDIAHAVYKAKIKSWEDNKTQVFYSSDAYALDLQSYFKQEFHKLYHEKYGTYLNQRKIGTLEEWVDVLGCKPEVDALYASLPKERETGAHGALYDVCMTYYVWKYCKEHELY